MDNIIYIHGVCDDDKKLNTLLDGVKVICDHAPKCKFILSESGELDKLYHIWTDYDKLYDFKITIEFKDQSALFNADPIIRNMLEECNKHAITSQVKLNLDTLTLLALKLMES